MHVEWRLHACVVLTKVVDQSRGLEGGVGALPVLFFWEAQQYTDGSMPGLGKYGTGKWSGLMFLPPVCLHYTLFLSSVLLA